MKEEFLHQIWRLKRFSQQALKTTDGRQLEIISPGWHNHESGPDFFNGKISLEGVQWSGNIEIHIKASDWYAHKHQLDRAYDNVILHVVYQADKDVYIHGELLPTLELKDVLNEHEWSKYYELTNSQANIACEKGIQKIDKLFIQQQIQRSLIQRFERKTELLIHRLHELKNDFQQLYFEQLAQCFGMKINAIPGVEFTQRLPYAVLMRTHQHLREALFLGLAGHLSKSTDNSYVQQLQTDWNFLKQKHQLTEMEVSNWKYFGLRPPSFPPYKWMLFAHYFDVLLEIIKLEMSDFKEIEKRIKQFQPAIHIFWNSHYRLENESRKHTPELTTSYISLLVVNVFAPILYFRGILKNDDSLKEKSIQLLEELKAEDNKITRVFTNLGLEIKSSAESQGILELKHELCERKKCISCVIGTKILYG
jgi:hypothetical protein